MQGAAALQVESLTADEGDVLVVLAEMVDELAGVVVAAQQDGHLAEFGALHLAQQMYLLRQVFIHLFIIQPHAHVAALAVVGLLAGVVGPFRLEHVGRCCEERVVEAHHLLGAAEVGVEVVGGLCVGGGEFVEFLPVAAAPAVDGLLHVAHEEAFVALGRGVDEKFFEVAPLQGARVLKLVYHDVFETVAGTLHHEGSVAAAELGEEYGRLGQHEVVLLIVDDVHLLRYLAQKA